MNAQFFRKFWFIVILLFVEGSSLMAVELIGAKLLAPFFGSSLYVWTSVLAITVLGLTLGYYTGGRLAKRKSTEKELILIISLAAVLVFALPFTASAVISLTAGIGLIPGIVISSIILLVPPVLLFGLIGPLVVKFMAQNLETVGNVAGTVYFTSTLGGIIATFLFGFYLIPEAGLRASSTITFIALALLPLIFFIKNLLTGKAAEILPEPASTQQAQKAKVNPKSTRKSPQVKQIKTAVYLFAALEGAAGMAVELISARMLAPYFGSSLYVWGAVIGITLLSLALGYYAGGWLADRKNDLNTIYWVVLIASFFLLFMHSTSQTLTLAFVKLDLLVAVVLVSLLLIVPVLFFLGMVPTLLIRYLTSKVDDAGAITGNVFTISSASGILVLPLLGFFIIPAFGLTVPSILIGVLVGIYPFWKLTAQKKLVSLLFILFIILSCSHRSIALRSTSDLDVKYYSEGLLGQVLVADVYKNGAGAPTNERELFVNRMGQTNINNLTQNSNWNYITFGISLASKIPVNGKALILGLGGGSFANAFQNNLKLQVDAVELDERIAGVATDYFNLSPSVNVIVDDARHYLETTHTKYDLIFFDVFKGDIFPPHVLSVECFKKAASLLNPNGLIIINFNGFLSDDIGKPGRSVYATLRAAGLETKLLPTPGPENERNTLFVASATSQKFQSLRSPLLHNGIPVNLETMFMNPDKLKLQDDSVLTDDKSTLDRLNIKAGNSWRKAYNETSTRFFRENGVPLFK